jgi:hypothetical protein
MQEQTNEQMRDERSVEYIARFAALALGCVAREFPNKLDHVMSDAAEVKTPRQLHPAFYGCFDWHSAVHGHWLLIHLLRSQQGTAPWEQEARRKIDANLTRENIKVETEYFNGADRKSFERSYGWAWLLKLQEELYLWGDPQAEKWCDALKPLAETVVGKYLDFFPKQKYPIRVGTHFNTAFGLSFAHDYAATLTSEVNGGLKKLDDESVRRLGELKSLIDERARAYFTADKNCPAAWEPSGDDFLSPSLVEADLMRRILAPEEFAPWFESFLPDIKHGEPRSLLTPADVTGRSDPKIVHLDGLNLSRAWCMKSIANALPAENPARARLSDSATRHAEATLPHVTSGDYAGEHWLATFAVLLLSTTTLS